MSTRPHPPAPWRLLAPCLLLLGLLSGCATTTTSLPKTDEPFDRLDQIYLNEVVKENQFDARYVESTHNDQGEFYPLTWLLEAGQVSEVFWKQYLEYQNQKGAKIAYIRLAQLIQRHGLCMIMAAHDGRRALEDSLYKQYLSDRRQSALFHYFYAPPGNTLLLHRSETFIEIVPGVTDKPMAPVVRQEPTGPTLRLTRPASPPPDDQSPSSGTGPIPLVDGPNTVPMAPPTMPPVKR